MSNLSKAGSTVTQETPDTNIINGALVNFVWTDIDLSSIVGGSAAGLAILRVTNNTGGLANFKVRMNGDTTSATAGSYNGTYTNVANGSVLYCACPFDAAGIVEYYCTGGNWKIDVIGYIHE